VTINKFTKSIDYKVLTPVFEGPLDLLLDLIEKAELDITSFSLAKVTDRFLEYIREMVVRDADEVSAFLVIAAKLVQIKSSVLLPRPLNPDSDAEEDPGEALVLQLREYRRFKQVANLLGEIQQKGYKTYLRLTAPSITVEPTIDMNDFNLQDLIASANYIFSNENLLPIDNVVALPRITVKEKIEIILKSFKLNESISFSSILTSTSRAEIVVTFLAVLELIKQNIIEAYQETPFRDISILPLAKEFESQEIDLEY